MRAQEKSTWWIRRIKSLVSKDSERKLYTDSNDTNRNFVTLKMKKIWQFRVRIMKLILHWEEQTVRTTSVFLLIFCKNGKKIDHSFSFFCFRSLIRPSQKGLLIYHRPTSPFQIVGEIKLLKIKKKDQSSPYYFSIKKPQLRLFLMYGVCKMLFKVWRNIIWCITQSSPILIAFLRFSGSLKMSFFKGLFFYCVTQMLWKLIWQFSLYTYSIYFSIIYKRNFRSIQQNLGKYFD